jgi:hypothetical protein
MVRTKGATSPPIPSGVWRASSHCALQVHYEWDIRVMASAQDFLLKTETGRGICCAGTYFICRIFSYHVFLHFLMEFFVINKITGIK